MAFLLSERIEQTVVVSLLWMPADWLEKWKPACTTLDFAKWIHYTSFSTSFGDQFVWMDDLCASFPVFIRAQIITRTFSTVVS